MVIYWTICLWSSFRKLAVGLNLENLQLDQYKKILRTIFFLNPPFKSHNEEITLLNVLYTSVLSDNVHVSVQVFIMQQPKINTKLTRYIITGYI